MIRALAFSVAALALIFGAAISAVRFVDGHLAPLLISGERQ